jgi:hypothetical protein
MLGSTLMLHAAKDRQHGGPQRKGEMTNIHYFYDIQGRQISNPAPKGESSLAAQGKKTGSSFGGLGFFSYLRSHKPDQVLK